MFHRAASLRLTSTQSLLMELRGSRGWTQRLPKPSVCRFVYPSIHPFMYPPSVSHTQKVPAESLKITRSFDNFGPLGNIHWIVPCWLQKLEIFQEQCFLKVRSFVTFRGHFQASLFLLAGNTHVRSVTKIIILQSLKTLIEFYFIQLMCGFMHLNRLCSSHLQVYTC